MLKFIGLVNYSKKLHFYKAIFILFYEKTNLWSLIDYSDFYYFVFYLILFKISLISPIPLNLHSKELVFLIIRSMIYCKNKIWPLSEPS